MRSLTGWRGCQSLEGQAPYPVFRVSDDSEVLA